MLANRKAAEQMLVRFAGQEEFQRTCDSVTKLFQNSMYAYHHFVLPLAPIIKMLCVSFCIVEFYQVFDDSSHNCF